MCVLAFAWQAHPRWRLVVAGNRDEFHARPAAPLARWSQPDDVIAGRDLQSGGTWAGVAESGRFVVVTNLRGHGAVHPDRRSRGALVSALLSGERSVDDLTDEFLADFNPFNLIVVDRERAHFVTNGPRPVRYGLAAGLYGLSNGTLDEPWPKTLRLKSRVLDWIVGDESQPDQLLDALHEDTLPAMGIAPASPSDVALEPRNTPVFIRHPVYGTRCSTVVLVDHRTTGTIAERRYSSAGDATGNTVLDFEWRNTPD